MNSRKLSFVDDRSLDETVSTALRESVGSLQPSPEVRESLLHAAAERQREQRAARRAAYQQQIVPTYQDAAEKCRDWSARSVTISPSTVLMLHARILDLRVVQ